MMFGINKQIREVGIYKCTMKNKGKYIGEIPCIMISPLVPILKIKTSFYTSAFHKITHQGTHEVINSWKLSKSVVYLPRSLPGFCYHWQQNECSKATVKSRIHTIWNCLCQAFLQGENNIQQLLACAYHICTHFGSIRKKKPRTAGKK